MAELRISRRNADGRETTYCVAVIDKTDRTLHNVTVEHNALYGFASDPELLTFVFERLLETRSKEAIRSSFRLKDLLDHDAGLRAMVKAPGLNPERERDDAVRQWLAG